jgi:hypothetical protein
LHSSYTGRVKPFVKKQPYEELKPARIILPRSDLVKAWYGMLVSFVSKIIYTLPCAVKFMTPIEKLNRLRDFEKYKLFYELDIRRMEACFTPVCFDVECYLFSLLLPYYSQELEVIRRIMSGSTKIVHDAFKLSVKSRRMSGEMTTAVTHLILNYCLIHYAAMCAHVNILDCVLEGDDNLCAVDGFIDFRIYEQIGFNLKVKLVHSVYETSFCHMTPGFGFHSLLRTPSEILMRLFWTQCKFKHGNVFDDRLLLAKALSYYNEYINCPIVVPLCLRIVTLLPYITPYFEQDDEYHVVYKFMTYKMCINLDDRVSFQMNYGISVDTQLRIEDDILSWTLDDPLPLSLCMICKWTNNANIFMRAWDKGLVQTA